MASAMEVELGSENLWADIGRPDADATLGRAQLMQQVTEILLGERIADARAAEILGTNQPTVSDLVRGKLSRFSLERLIAFLNALDRDVEITVRPTARGSTRARFVVTGD